jgi:ABC-type multidrug transport system fused ATPase/permease subunit
MWDDSLTELSLSELQNPRVLLLDEATSALDSESEGEVQAALERAMHGRTVLVIAHRLGTASRASRIIFIERGKITEEGTHQQLMAKKLVQGGGVTYRAMCEMQSRALE